MEAIREGETFSIPDTEVEFATRPAMRELAQTRGWRSSLGVPLMHDGKPIGVITVTRMEPGRFDDHHVQLAADLCRSGSDRHRRTSRLFEEVQAKTRDLTESLEQQTATSEVLEVISASTGELEPVFQKMLENATRICGATSATMYLYEGATTFNVRATTYRRRSPTPQRTDPIRIRKTVWPRSPEPDRRSTSRIFGCRPAYSTAIRPLRDCRSCGRAGHSSIVPMLKEDELIGAIAILPPGSQPFTDKQIELVDQFRRAGRDRDREHAAAQGIARTHRRSRANRCSSRPRPPTCSRSSAAPPSTLRLFSTRWWRRWRASAAPTSRLCSAGEMTSITWLRLTALSEEAKDFVLTHPFAPDRGTMTGRVGLERRVVHIPDVLQDPEYTYREVQKIAGYRYDARHSAAARAMS